MIDCDCPRCGSRSTKALPVLHRDGTRTANYRKSGWFYYRRSFGVHRTWVEGRTQSLAAEMAEPPGGRLTAGGVALVLFIGAALGGAIGFWVALALMVLLAIVGSNATAYDQKVRTWESTFRCNRCGTSFVLLEEDEEFAQLQQPSTGQANLNVKSARSTIGR